MFPFYDSLFWLCVLGRLLGNLVGLFTILILGSVFSDSLIFYGGHQFHIVKLHWN